MKAHMPLNETSYSFKKNDKIHGRFDQIEPVKSQNFEGNISLLNKMASVHTCIAKKHVISSSLKARVENQGNRKTLKFSFAQTFVDTNDS